MRPGHCYSSLLIMLVLGLAFPVQAAKPLFLQRVSLNQLKQKFALTTKGVAFAKDSLRFIREHTDRHKISHIRLQQHYAGFPVFGGYVIMHSLSKMKSLTSQQPNVMMNGVVYQGLHSELGQVDPSFVQAGNLALEQFKFQYAAADLSEERVIPMVYIDSQHRAHWAYKISVFIHYPNKIPERPTAIIDAKTNETLVQWNDLKTQKLAIQGVGFGGNHKIGKYEFGTTLPVLELTRDSISATCFMENPLVKVINMDHKYSTKTQKAMEFSCPKTSSGVYFTGYNADGYDEYNGAFSPSNDALYAGYLIKHMYSDWYGVDVLTNPDGSPMQLIMRVHYGYDYENAYWDGQQMTFGDGNSMTYPLVSLSISSHEVSHGFTEQHSNLEYYGQSGGINESFSDMAAQAAEYYSLGKNSWHIGEEVMKEDSGYEVIRYMDRPSRDGKSIDRADEYDASLDVHYSSGVYNRLFYILANQPNWDTRKAFNVMLKANMDYWTPYSTFAEGACGVLSATADLGYSQDDVKKSLRAVAINFDACLPLSLA